jgi:hypothetical protein
MQETYLLRPIPLGPVSNSIQMAHTSLPCTIFFLFFIPLPEMTSPYHHGWHKQANSQQHLRNKRSRSHSQNRIRGTAWTAAPGVHTRWHLGPTSQGLHPPQDGLGSRSFFRAGLLRSCRIVELLWTTTPGTAESRSGRALLGPIRYVPAWTNRHP